MEVTPAWFKSGKRVLGTNRVSGRVGVMAGPIGIQHRHDELKDVEHT